MAEPTDIAEASADTEQGVEAQSLNIRRSYLKMGAVILFIAMCVCIVHFTPLKQYLSDLQSVRSVILATGYKAPLIFFAVAGVSIFIGAPRLPFCLLGGMLFGFVQGLVLALGASLAGAYGPFLFGRYTARDWARKRLGQMKIAGSIMENPTIFHVFMFRQLPVWGVLTSLLLGSIGVSHFRFVVGSLFGFLPQAVIFALIGGGIAEKSFLLAVSKVCAAVPLLAVAAYVTWRSISHSLNKFNGNRVE